MNGLDQDWVRQSNEATLYHMERQARTGPGLVPFLGAGTSLAYQIKTWKNLLQSAAPPDVAGDVKKLLNDGKYEEAAEALLTILGPDGFQNVVAAAAGDANLDRYDFTTGTVSLLPFLASGPVVTTNFDRVLERAFEANGKPFESVISGPRPDLIVDALHGHRRVLIKLHGDWQDRVGRTFSKSDYETNYGESQPEKKRELLEGVERLLFSSRSLLFIGASLAQDRTVERLKKVHLEYAGIRHFAIMTLPATASELREKERHLRECGILPLWHSTIGGHAQQVEKAVSTIIDRISFRRIEAPAVDPEPPGMVEPGETSGALPKPEHFDRVARLVHDGRLIFFLGSAIHHPTLLLAAAFYRELARIFDCEALGEERFAVAQYIADRYGREELNAEIRKLFRRTWMTARATHRMFAEWAAYRTSDGQPVPPPIVLTTNYDDILERSLATAGVPFHLLSYQPDGPYRGLFYHRTPENELRIVERPENFRTISNHFVVVKLNGGRDPRGQMRESYASTRLDYLELAARIPTVLPAFLQHALTANPLLFLGHGLKALDIESLVRYAHRNRPGPRSWAVVLGGGGIEYWRQLGVEILQYDVNAYVAELRRRLITPAPPLDQAM